jgi:hypothetical protein
LNTFLHPSDTQGRNSIKFETADLPLKTRAEPQQWSTSNERTTSQKEEVQKTWA